MKEENICFVLVIITYAGVIAIASEVFKLNISLQILFATTSILFAVFLVGLILEKQLKEIKK